MKVLFLDCDGTLDNIILLREYLRTNLGEDSNNRDVKNLVDSNKVLAIADWAIENDVEIVIDSLIRDQERNDYINEILKTKGKELYGITDEYRIKTGKNAYTDSWKENNIYHYLLEHPEIDKFVIIDDEDIDLKTLSDYLVLIDNRNDTQGGGLHPYHLEQASEILKKENIFRGKDGNNKIKARARGKKKVL